MCHKIRSYGSNLDEKEFQIFFNKFKLFENTLMQKETDVSRKRKIEKQLYFPNKKPK